MDVNKLVQYKDFGQPLYVVLNYANLEVAMTKKGVELINSDDHYKFIENKLIQDPEEFRPDIVHQTLLALLDS